MALARKCDICGRLYENYSTEIRNASGKVNGVSYIHKSLNSSQLTNCKSMDCCHSCFNAIVSFIEDMKDRFGDNNA